jgi:hypothetical protein
VSLTDLSEGNIIIFLSIHPDFLCVATDISHHLVVGRHSIEILVRIEVFELRLALERNVASHFASESRLLGSAVRPHFLVDTHDVSVEVSSLVKLTSSIELRPFVKLGFCYFCGVIRRTRRRRLGALMHCFCLVFKREDLIARDFTGSGITVGFGLPLSTVDFGVLSPS